MDSPGAATAAGANEAQTTRVQGAGRAESSAPSLCRPGRGSPLRGAARRDSERGRALCWAGKGVPRATHAQGPNRAACQWRQTRTRDSHIQARRTRRQTRTPISLNQILETDSDSLETDSDSLETDSDSHIPRAASKATSEEAHHAQDLD